jgi:hypothetical protein
MRPSLIENGSILEVHGEAGLGVLYYDDPAPFGEFELRLQWKTFQARDEEEAANSGIFLRAPIPTPELDDANFYNRAIEVQIDDSGYDAAAGRFRSPLHRTGAIYGIAPARLWAAKAPSTDGTPGIWNEFRIVAEGPQVSVQLNGSLVSEGIVPLTLTAPGLIAVQYHTGKVQFRSIRIRRL